MPSLQQHYLVITALGTNRPGIVNTITRHVSSCGCNIEDSRLAMLGEEFTFIMLLSGGWNAIAQIESTLPLKGAELDLLIVMKRTNAQEQPATPTTVWVTVEVDDSPHIIERYTDLFDSHQMTLAELASKTQPAMERLTLLAHRRHDISARSWKRIEPLLPGRKGKWGGVAKDNRLFINAVFWILRTGSPWRDLPPDYGCWKNTHRRFCRWKNKGVWASIFENLTCEADMEWLMIDATHIKVHLHGTGAGNDEMGLTKGDLTASCTWPSKHMVCHSEQF